MNKLWTFSIVLTYILLSQTLLANNDEQFIEVTKGNKITRIKVLPYNKNDRMKSELIPLESIGYNTIEQICKPMLSKKGTIGFIPERNSIFVYDKLKVINRIKKIVKSVDYPVVNIRVNIDFNQNSINRGYGVRNKSKNRKYYSPVETTIVNGKIIKRNNSIRFSDFAKRSGRNTFQFIVATSGSSASLWVGRKIIDPSWLRNYRFRPTIIIDDIIISGSNPDFVWTNVGSSLQVLPRYLGNGLIEVEVFPQLSYIDGNRKKRYVKFEGISTKVILRSGQKMNIGGVINKQKDFYTDLFGPDFVSDKTGNSILDMTISAEVMKPIHHTKTLRVKGN